LAKPARLMCMIMQCVITYCNLNFFDGMISVVYSIYANTWCYEEIHMIIFSNCSDSCQCCYWSEFWLCL